MKINTITNPFEFMQAINNDKCVIKVGTPHCGACNVTENNLKSVIEKVYPDWSLYVVDAEQCNETILEMMGVKNIPFVYFKNGIHIEKKAGLLTESQITSILQGLTD